MSRRQAAELAKHLEAYLCKRGRSSGGRHTRPRAAPAASPPPAAGHDVVPSTAQPPAAGQEWTEVVHQPTGLTYYWNKSTNETTALGEPRPGAQGRLQHHQQAQLAQSQLKAGAAGLGQLVAMGAGVGLVFALLSRLL